MDSICIKFSIPDLGIVDKEIKIDDNSTVEYFKKYLVKNYKLPFDHITLHCGQIVLDEENEIKNQIDPNKDGSYSITVQMEDAIHMSILNNKEQWFKYDNKSTIRDMVMSLTLDKFEGIEIYNFEKFKEQRVVVT